MAPVGNKSLRLSQASHVKYKYLSTYLPEHSLQDFNSKETYPYRMNRSVAFRRRRKMFCFSSFSSIHMIPFLKCAAFKICRQKMWRLRVKRRHIRHIFHRFQNVPVSCERSQKCCEKSERTSNVFHPSNVERIVKRSFEWHSVLVYTEIFS